MARRLKVSGLAWVVALSIGAVAPAAALGTPEFMAGSYPAIITGEQINEPEGEPDYHRFEFSARTFRCEIAHFEGDMTESSSTVSITPTFESCAGGAFPVTVTTNGCDFVLHASEGAGDAHEGVLDIVCPEGKMIEAHIFTNAMAHSVGFNLCLLTIFPQTEVGTMEILNDTEASPDDVTLITTLQGLKYETHGISWWCGPLEVQTENLFYTGITTLTAFQDDEGLPGEQVDLVASGE